MAPPSRTYSTVWLIRVKSIATDNGFAYATTLNSKNSAIKKCFLFFRPKVFEGKEKKFQSGIAVGSRTRTGLFPACSVPRSRHCRTSIPQPKTAKFFKEVHSHSIQARIRHSGLGTASRDPGNPKSGTPSSPRNLNSPFIVLHILRSSPFIRVQGHTPFHSILSVA